MDPVLLQKQLKDNAADLNNFYQDLKTWGQDMKRKEEKSTTKVPNNKLTKRKKTVEPKEKEKPKPKVTDYSKWDKFDVEAECEKIDYNENEESDLTDECDENVRDQAYVEKEKGNKFVASKKWDEAIKCYNKAIECYSYDPVFYANRALCFLKKEDYQKTELDCTMSIRLDAKYVKAYQRRAAAREALGKLTEAESDLLQILELEPKNKESRNHLIQIRKHIQNQKVTEGSQRPTSIFTASRNRINANLNKEAHKIKEQIIPVKEHWNNTEDLIIVKPVIKSAHNKSKKPLKRIHIQEILGIEAVKEDKSPSFPKVNENTGTLKIDDLRIIEKTS